MITIMEARKMSMVKIRLELAKHAEKLEKFGMSHEEAYAFLSSVMNLGIASQENQNARKKKKYIRLFRI